MGKRKTLDKDGIWRPRKLKIIYTDEKLTAGAGLGPLVDAFVESPQYEKIKACVPSRSGNAAYDSMQFVLPLMAGFWHGYDCLEDMEKLETKPDMSYRLEGIPTPRAFGDFLRDFTPDHIEKINNLLVKQSLAARKQFAPDRPIILDMDGTSHVQSGSKIEGLGVNYKHEICLESLDSFDELGFCYGFRLRDGGTFSGVGAPAEIDRIFSHLKYADEKHFRGDSAYCNEEVVRACLKRGAHFTITIHGNTGWETHIPEISNWKPWVYSEVELKWAEKRKIALPEIEVGTMLYQPGWAENLRFQVAVKRTRIENPTLFDKGNWRYYGVLTNWNLVFQSPQQVLERTTECSYVIDL